MKKKGHLSKINWQRASRTDKWVHAACNCVSCKLSIGQNFMIETRDLNSDDFKAMKQKEKIVDFTKIMQTLNANLRGVKIFCIFFLFVGTFMHFY